MHACNVTLPTPVIFSCILVLFCLTAILQNALNTSTIAQKLRIKRPNIVSAGAPLNRSAPDPAGDLTTLPQTSYFSRQGDRINFFHCVHYHFTSGPVSPPWKKLDRNCIRHNALANYSNNNTTKSEKGIRKGYFVVKTPVKILISSSARVLLKHGLWKNM